MNQSEIPFLLSLIPARLKLVGTERFARLNLTKAEIQLFVTEADRSRWTPAMRNRIPKFDETGSDEEE